MKNSIFFLGIIFLIVSCGSNKDPQLIIDRAIEVAGGNKYVENSIQFDFRNKRYRIKRSDTVVKMMRIFKEDSIKIKDYVSNKGFQRTLDGVEVNTNDSLAGLYVNSINSVFYFALLPYGLNDAAVRKNYLGSKNIKGKEYDKIEITFAEEGGGKDFKDVYIYWINQESSKIGYLAYSYEVDGGGLRFREAQNERYVEGIRFVDYVNYKADPEVVSLKELDDWFEAGKLQKLSLIQLENIKVKNMDEEKAPKKRKRAANKD